MKRTLREIEATLRAIRAGWIGFPKEHIRALQAERVRLIAARRARIEAH